MKHPNIEASFLPNLQRKEAFISNCKKCKTMLVWNQAGDVPDYCDNCYHALKGMERIHTPTWMQTEIECDGSFLDRMDLLCHYSPETQRWYIKEPNRWIKAAEIEVERLFSFLWWKDRKNPSSQERQDEVCYWQKAIQEFKNYCVDRCETKGK